MRGTTKALYWTYMRFAMTDNIEIERPSTALLTAPKQASIKLCQRRDMCE
jgi:hypothetical protein